MTHDITNSSEIERERARAVLPDLRRGLWEARGRSRDPAPGTSGARNPTNPSLPPAPDRAALTVGPGMDMPIMHDSDRYELVRDIGSGNFGVARLMRDRRTSELVAVKYIERGEKVTR
nr:unnamed protein product [Digitaria exilis]